MAELFGRANGGLGLSFTRLTVGASDFSPTHYSYDDTPGNVPDPELRYFSIEPARKYVLAAHPRGARDQPRPQGDDQPVERAGLDEDDAQPDPGPARAAILSSRSRTISRARSKAFGREGVPVSMLTIQNEPDFEPGDYPGMRVNSPDRAMIIGGFVGPTFRARGLKTQILDYDHNWDDPEMPLTVLADPVARQLCLGRRLALLRRRCPGAVAGSRRLSRQGCLAHRMLGRRMVAEICRSARLDDRQADHRRVQQLVARDAAVEPRARPEARAAHGRLQRLPRRRDDRPGHRGDHPQRRILCARPCQPVRPPGRLSRRRLRSAVAGVEAAAFVNPDGSRVAILYRKSANGPVTIALDGERYAVALPQGSVATVRWRARSGRQVTAADQDSRRTCARLRGGHEPVLRLGLHHLEQ